jgi:hypothetical protein
MKCRQEIRCERPNFIPHSLVSDVSAGNAGDPSLRLKGGSVRDDANEGVAR